MANTFDQTKTKFKFKVLSSFLLTEEKKAELLKNLDTFSEEQMNSISAAIDAAETEAKPMVDAGFASPKGEGFFQQLKQADSKLKRNTRKQEEKEDRAGEAADLEATLEELEGLDELNKT